MGKSPLQQAREAPGSTKARILAAAEDVFAARGFEGAGTREIAARAGVNISSLHYHWASKETLYVAVFHDIFERLLDLLRATLARPDDQRDREVVVSRVMRELVAFMADHPTVPKLLARRLLETDVDLGIDREVLVPAWTAFTEQMGRTGRRMSDTESRLFMLSAHSVLLIYMLDSPSYQSLLGGSVFRAPLREQVERHLVRLVEALLEP
ncbi:MAG TPA: helix-turn-helix domain-containing protein [Candidatus Eisenbacteria bacterium]|nr:helix-turn-helix domain-containing protein [Candidatus Eisenbacteria bacterium]